MLDEIEGDVPTDERYKIHDSSYFSVQEAVGHPWKIPILNINPGHGNTLLVAA
jgi:hypothetical protein